MEGVRVSHDSEKPAQLNALAFTQGRDIYLGPNQEKHLPHEAWHVVQQQQQGRVQATRQLKGMGLNDDAALEREADEMGARAARWQGEVSAPLPPAKAPSTVAVQRMVGNALKKGDEVRILDGKYQGPF